MTRRPLAIFLTAFGALVAVLGAVRAGAQKNPGAPPTAPAPVVALFASPIFGQDATSGSGWSDIVARIDNISSAPQKGTVELLSAPSYGGADKFTARAPFNVPAGKTAIVRLPVHSSTYYSPGITVTASGEKGQKLASVNVTVNGQPSPLLVDIDQPSRVSVAMRGWPMTTSWSPTGATAPYGSATASVPLAVGVPMFDRTTGDPVLPEHAAGYTAVTAVLLHSDALARLDPVSLDALVNWVLAGGTLAVVPNRPEDLRGPVLTALIGGEVSKAAMPAHLLRLPGALRAPAGTGVPGLDPFADPDASPPPTTTPMKWSSTGPLPITPVITPTHGVRIGPGEGVQSRLTGWSGGNLHPSDFGASAAYGLGEVHLLAFDPTEAPMLDDPWVHARIVDMMARGWERRALVAFPHGAGERNGYRSDDVRRALDPNENFRPGLGISALLLVIYSIVAGPVLFLRATRKGRPLSPLLWAPIFSAAAFGAIVFVGLASKGWRGRARHLSLVETGAGVTRGTVRRYRGFFASETRSLSVQGTDRTCVVDVASGDTSTHENAVLRVDRNGVALENLTGLPWQTVVVREDGFMDFKGGLSVLGNPDATVDVVNHTGRTLKDVLVWVPGDKVTYFAELKDGARVRSTSGKNVLAASARRPATSGTKTVHPLQARDLGFAISARYNDRVIQAWSPLESAAGEAVDWWPDDVPVVMGEMTGGELARSDSGLALENDRVLFRVVGKGGTP